MPTYKNNNDIILDYNNVTWSPEETKSVYFYVPSILGLTETDPEPVVDPLLYVNEAATIAVETPLEISVPVPTLSPMYHLSILVSAGTVTLQFNDDGNNSVTLTIDDAFDQTIYWHVAPIVILTATEAATVTIIVSEMLSPIVY